MNKDGSWAVFSCDRGFRLHGSSVLYCKGLSWNATNPVCKGEHGKLSKGSSSVTFWERCEKVLGLTERFLSSHLTLASFSSLESDMMSSVSAAALHSQQHPYYNSITKEAPLISDLSHMSSQMSNSEKIKVTNPEVQPQQQILFSKLQVSDGDQKEVNKDHGPETETGGGGTEGTASGKEAEEESKSHQSTTVSSALSLVSGTVSPPSYTTVRTAMMTAVTTTAVSEQTHPTVMFATTLQPLTDPALQDGGAPPSEAAPGSSHTGCQFCPSLPQPGSADDDQHTETPTHTSSTSALSSSTSSASPASSAPPSSTSFPFFTASASLSPSSAQAEMKTQQPDVIPPSNNTPKHHNQTLHGTTGPPPLSQSPSRPPVCPYPPVPAHGTLYFHNVENPGARESRHYIQYACYPGYTLAHGDIHSFCQQGGTWSGITPVCLGR